MGYAVYNINIDYAAREEIRKLSRDELLKLHEEIPQLNLGEYLESDMERWWGADFIGDRAVLAKLIERDIKVTLRKIKGLSYNGLEDFLSQAEKDPRAQTVIYNVSVPNVGYADVKTVTWLEDCCTEHLQRHLDAGWRILAVCPPNDSRRPTYIIGHVEAGRKDIY